MEAVGTGPPMPDLPPGERTRLSIEGVCASMPSGTRRYMTWRSVTPPS